MSVLPDEEFIAWAQAQLGDGAVAEKEAYGDQSAVYRLHLPNRKYFLKIGTGLAKERERLDWLKDKLPVPDVIGFSERNGKEMLLLSAIEGTNLAELSKSWPKEKVVEKLVAALHRFHGIDPSGCPFGAPGPDTVLVHGDACLPNFIFQGDELSGYIDLGDAGVYSPDVDFAAAIWSLKYNLGPGYGVQFLEKYGVMDASEEYVERLRLKYEEMQETWGL